MACRPTFEKLTMSRFSVLLVLCCSIVLQLATAQAPAPAPAPAPASDPMAQNIKMYITIACVVGGIVLCCIFLYVCRERLLPIVGFLEHAIFTLVTWALLPFKWTWIAFKWCFYPIKESTLGCCKRSTEYYKPWSRTT
eukprot:TRINITY_DN16062_c0_g2_i1.p1 TRINITY_DN16062_c0_g2~~TRINITY_DN16062_c0_g2_i1.p1  ORF type:complete len:156 (-),score=52.77 TRINITY_DN16062_c0_g2_i1:88-501(-)